MLAAKKVISHLFVITAWIKKNWSSGSSFGLSQTFPILAGDLFAGYVWTITRTKNSRAARIFTIISPLPFWFFCLMSSLILHILPCLWVHPFPVCHTSTVNTTTIFQLLIQGKLRTHLIPLIYASSCVKITNFSPPRLLVSESTSDTGQELDWLHLWYMARIDLFHPLFQTPYDEAYAEGSCGRWKILLEG